MSDLDPAQLRAAQAPRSVVVTAGAGTGKTHMLSHRYLHHLRQGFRPLQVVAVTFTRRAAEELRARIREVVRRALEGEDSLDPEMLAEVEAAPIGTIHALAQTVCRRYPEAAGVPPDFAVVDELDGQLWQTEALEEALARLPADAFGSMPFEPLRSALRSALEDPRRVQAALAVDAGQVEAQLAAARHAAFALSAGSQAWADDLGFLAAASGPAGHASERWRALAVLHAGRLASSGPDGDPEEARASWEALSTLRYNLGAKKDWHGPPLDEVKAAMKRIRQMAEAAWDGGSGAVTLSWGPVEEEAHRHAMGMRRTLEAVLASVAERKRRAKSLTFADLETHALQALASADVRHDLHRRWRALLVDEVQDVNPTQAELLRLLRAQDAPLTAVGDAKQSIYGFRGAAPEVLAELQRMVEEEPEGRTVTLGTSYRSHEGLVGVVNQVFDSALGEEAGPLVALRPARTDGSEPLRLRTLAAGASASGDDVAAEAESIAQALSGLLHAEPPLMVDDRSAPGGSRPMEVGDMAVLARGHATLAQLEARLPAHGLPVLNAGGGDVLATQEATDARALLRAVVDPTDGVAIAGLLRSPYVAAADRAIAGLALRHGHAHDRGHSRGGGGGRDGPPPWWAMLDQADDPAIARGGALLAELRLARQQGARASELLRLADDRTGVSAVLANLPQGPRRVADLHGVTDLLLRLEQRQADALGVVRRLERLVAMGVKVQRPPLRARGAVALLTIHAAKGLEWPVVVVADLSGSGREQRDDLLVDPDLGVALRWSDRSGGKVEPASFRLAASRAKAREAEETRRLAYVAFTRARDLLILSDRGRRLGGLRRALGEALVLAGVAVEEVRSGAADLSAPPEPPLPPAPDPMAPGWRRDLLAPR